MKILSFDVGIKNLALCVIEDHIIKYWDVLEVPNGQNENLCINLVKVLDENKYLLDSDTVVIEKQPSRNNKMRIMENLLTSYFIIKGVNDPLSSITKIKVYSAKHKLGKFTVRGKTNYSARKKLSITRCTEFLKRTEQTKDILVKFDKSKKKDDLADSLLQALKFLNSKILEEIENADLDTVCYITARKPTKTQETKGYSKANIKWILLNMTYTDRRNLEGKIESLPKLSKAIKFWYPNQGLEQTLRECKMVVT
jgi:hypothetical protein